MEQVVQLVLEVQLDRQLHTGAGLGCKIVTRNSLSTGHLIFEDIINFDVIIVSTKFFWCYDSVNDIIISMFENSKIKIRDCKF